MNLWKQGYYSIWEGNFCTESYDSTSVLKYTLLVTRHCNLRCEYFFLLAHGTADTTIPISDMRLIEVNATAQRPVKSIEVEGAEHDSIEHFHEHAELLGDSIQENM
jgi:hypothetical protein